MACAESSSDPTTRTWTINVLYPLDDPKKRAVGSSSPKG